MERTREWKLWGIRWEYVGGIHRNTSPGKKFRPTGASGLKRRTNMQKDREQYGPCCGVNYYPALKLFYFKLPAESPWCSVTGEAGSACIVGLK